jgi:uncharacterized membrane protein YccF (DUF307 family)
MTNRSCWVLCLGLLLATRDFLVYCTSPTARANIKKPRVASMPVPRKLLRSALVDLHHNQTIMNDKWLTLKAIRNLIYTRFDFNAGIDLAVRELKKAANEVGPLGSKISQGNHAIVRSSDAMEIFCQRARAGECRVSIGRKHFSTSRSWNQRCMPSGCNQLIESVG